MFLVMVNEKIAVRSRKEGEGYFQSKRINN